MRDRRTEGKNPKKLFCARLTAVFLAVGIAVAATTGCAVKQEEPDDGKLKIVTTIFPQYDFVRAIAGDTGAVNVRMLLSPGEEVHSYEPTPLDIKEIQNCDLFIYVGAENDVWVDRILENMGDKRPETLRLVDLTETVEEESVEGMMEEKGHDHEDAHEEEADHDHEEGHEEEDQYYIRAAADVSFRGDPGHRLREGSRRGAGRRNVRNNSGRNDWRNSRGGGRRF